MDREPIGAVEIAQDPRERGEERVPVVDGHRLADQPEPDINALRNLGAALIELLPEVLEQVIEPPMSSIVPRGRLSWRASISISGSINASAPV